MEKPALLPPWKPRDCTSCGLLSSRAGAEAGGGEAQEAAPAEDERPCEQVRPGAGGPAPPPKAAPARGGPLFRMVSAMIFACVRVYAGVLWFLCHTWPRVFLRFVPRGRSALSLANFYFYAQALGLLWVFVVSLLAAISMNVLQTALSGDDEGNAGAAAAASVARRPMRTLVIVYIYHCLCRILVLGSGTMWMVMWETYHDFPTLRVLMLGKNRLQQRSPERPTAPRSRSASDVVSPELASGGEGEQPGFQRQTSPSDGHGEVYVARRRIVLSTPLVVLNCLNLTILVGQGLCEGHLEDHCRGMEFFNPTSRINRNVRFVLFVAMLQWLQAWTGLFPYWHQALRKSKHWAASLAMWVLILGLVPASVLRGCLWLFRPAGTGVSQLMIFGLRHFFVDALLVTGWSLWLSVASSIVLGRGVVHLSGFSTRMIRDDEAWETLTGSFKFTLAIWELIAWVRGVAKLGFAHGQSDWIFITMLYPWLLAFIWTVTFILVAVARYGLWLPTIIVGFVAGAAGCTMAARLICGMADRLDRPLLVAVVWLYLGRQAFRLARGMLRQATGMDKAAASPREKSYGGTGTVSFSVSMLESSKSERRLAMGAVKVLLLICFTFIMVLTACVLLGGLQQRVGLILEDVMYWQTVPSGVEITNAEVSRMLLGVRSAGGGDAGLDPSVAALPPGAPPRYAVCGHQWYGLSLLDYGLLSSVSYMSNTPRNDLPKLFRLLMPNRRVTVRAAPSSSRKWLDLEVQTCGDNATGAEGGRQGCRNVTVVSISGTDPTRFSDYAENIRMWTEPVALQILSALFPSVRTWPRDTTAEVIALMHSTLQCLAIQDDRWHYQEILNHVRRKPPGEDVVLTGHSLGGGMALVVGALTGRLSVALQPPGVYHSLAKHQLQQDARGRRPGDNAVHQRSVTLKFEGDWVQHFDEHGGLVQTMSCDRSHQGVQMACHMLEGALCHLLRHCGDPDQRFASCSHEYAMTSAAETILHTLWSQVRLHWRSAGWKALDAYANLGPALRTALCVSILAGLRQAPRLGLPRRLVRWLLGAGPKEQ